MTFTANQTYRDLAALLAENADKTQDGWMQNTLVLANSVQHLMDEYAQRLVDDALDSAESPFRRIMDEQEQELQGVYAALHRERADNDDLREKLAVRQAVSSANLAAETRRGIDYAVTSPVVMRFLDKTQKISAIKEVRRVTGIGLKAAKDAVESREVQEAFANDCWCVVCTGIE